MKFFSDKEPHLHFASDCKLFYLNVFFPFNIIKEETLKGRAESQTEKKWNQSELCREKKYLP